MHTYIYMQKKRERARVRCTNKHNFRLRILLPRSTPCPPSLQGAELRKDLVEESGEEKAPIAETETRIVSAAPSDSPYFMIFTLTMPYNKVEFEAQQVKYTAAVASAAGTPVANVDILSVTEKPRRVGSSCVCACVCVCVRVCVCVCVCVCVDVPCES